ncbi:DEAD/DEAH box helicase [Prosthecomicrobium pneumaticum]|uniref:ATP-dependent RNA helicase DeaD n=1 Tax=Prosthecomicrobium pneumaticum TaxID=81895 RepID=A0A7W9L437_9HYPH|nr:DEAD/DEAH box helicase [Prosthecomicrobium pneumaticum]MBB5755195.1 ATP-dependent RNA helicase DeaD [Prosthecomicrobium pneumaticum]
MTPNDPAAPEDGMAAIHPALASALAAKGYTELTPVQTEMAEGGHGEADLLVSAQTGSGKTVAFGIAIASTLLGTAERFGVPGAPLGLVVAPTRELAIQVQRELDWLYAETGIATATCVGGMDMRGERRALDRGAHLVVGTPGRLRDHISRGALDLGGLRAVVLDEADEMLDLGFREDLEFILGAAPPERRTLLFSATVPRGIAELAASFQRDAVRVVATAANVQHADIDYQLMLVRRDEREHAVINTLLEADGSALVFCHTREAVRHLTARLANRGFPVVSLSGEMAQSERSNALQSMRDGRAHVCVATDVAARGIDLPNLDLVIHADVPSNPATLLHRSGRTGRAGRKGVCVLIVPENRRGAAQRVLALAKLAATIRPAPAIAEIEARYRAQILEAALAAEPPEESEAAFVAELVARVAPERLAAAFLRQQLAARPVPEDLVPLPVGAMPPRKGRRDERFEEARGAGPAQPAAASGPGPVRPARGPDMEGGVWFSLPLGRKHRADPKWLLPMICKAGGVSKRDVGAIRIDETETRFEIAAEAADAFAEAVRQPGATEKGLVIAPAEPAAERPRPARPRPGPKREGRPPAGGEGRPPYRGKGASFDRPSGGRPKGGRPKRPG